MKQLKFAENLKAVLKLNNMTQKQLAEQLGTTQQTISRWIQGTNEPDYATLIKICIILNENPDSLLGFDENH